MCHVSISPWSPTPNEDFPTQQVMAAGTTPSGKGLTDPVKIVANIFISFIGAGVLGLPYAFEEVRGQSLVNTI